MYRIDSTKEKPDAKGLLESVAKMMNRGIRVGNVEALYDTCIEIQERWKKDIKQKYNISNPNSSAQVISYLDSLNDARVVEVCTSNGKWTSNKQVMLELSYYGYDIGTDIVGYRTAKKYADSIKSIIDAKDSSNLIHPSVTLTKTNRISYKEPALMNIPKQLLWDVVVPYKPGSVLISADIKNQEPSILINANRVKSLQPALQADIGLYEAMFSKLPITCKLNVVFTDGMTPGVIDNDELRVMDVQPIYYTPKRAPFSGIHIGSMEGPEIQLIAVTNLIVPLGTMPVLPDSIVAITEKGEMLTKASFELDKNAASFKKAMKSGGIVSIEGILTDVGGDIPSMFLTKIFDFGMPHYYKNVPLINMAFGNNGGEPISVSFVTEQGEEQGETVTLSESNKDEYSPEYVHNRQLRPCVRLINRIGVKAECEGAMSVDSISLDYRALGGAR